MKKNNRRMKWILGLVLAMLIQTPFAFAEDNLAKDNKETDEQADKQISIQNEYLSVGIPLTVDVSQLTGDLDYTWQVNNVIKGKEATYTLQAEDLGKFVSVTVNSNGETFNDELYFSKLPVIYIDTENNAEVTSKDNYINAQLFIQGNETYQPENTTLYKGATEIKGRGNSTWGLPKKPYKLKLDKKTDLFGFGKNKHWVLLANYYDTTFMRNKLSYDLSGAMGMPYMQSVLTDVVFNGRYVGNYQLCEQIRIDKKRVNILDWEEEAENAAAAIAAANQFSKAEEDALSTQMGENLAWVTSNQVTFQGIVYTISDYYEIKDIDGGYLLELDANMDEVSKFTTDKQQPIMFKSPEFVNTNNEMFGYVKEYIQAFENAVYADDHTVIYQGNRKHYSELFDIDSLVDYWIINEIFFNEDAMKKSTYLYKDSGELFKMGPVWDMDWSSGAAQSAATATDQWHTLYFSMGAQQWQWYKELVKDPYFLKQVQNRYWQIRDNLIQDMLDSIDPMAANIQDSAQASLNVWGQGNYNEKVNALKDWLTKRMMFLDGKLDSYETLAQEFHVQDDTKELNVTYADGSALSEDSLSHASAGYQAMADSDRKLTVSMPAQDAETAQLWFNGTCIDEVQVLNNTITFELSGLSKDGVLQVYGFDQSGAVIVQGYKALKANAVKAIEVKAPVKDTYFSSEMIVFDDVEVFAHYSDGSKKQIHDAVFSEVKKEAGTQTITVSYLDQQTTFDITIIDVSVSQIIIESMPDKLEYTQGEAFDSKGMSVIAVYNDGTQREIFDYNVSPITDEIGRQMITVSYQGKKASLTITVNQRPETQQPEKPDQPDNTDKPAKPQEPDKPDSIDDPSKPQEPDHADQPVKPSENPTMNAQKPTDESKREIKTDHKIIVNTGASAENHSSMILLLVCLLGFNQWIKYIIQGTQSENK